MPAREKPEPTPVFIGGFPVVRLLGEGGMGNVYACKDEKLGRLVAIKVLKDQLARQPKQAARFLREAQAMARIQSPHVVTVYQVGEEDGAPFLVMELLEGEDLSERIKRDGPLLEREAVKHLRGSIRGLRDATDAGVIHRDVKPANLFVVDGDVKLTDFGLSLPVDADAKLTQEGLVVGTPHYLAPELARGGQATEASDIYALGATLFELVTGHPPYPGKAALDVVSAHLHDPVPSPRSERRELSRQIDRLIMRMMAKDAQQRYRSYDELEKAIRNLEVENAPTVVRNTPLPTEAQPERAPVPRPEDPKISQSSLPNAKAMRTQTLTILHLDVEGYAERIAHASREKAGQWLALHEGLIQPIVRVYGGKRVNAIGDAILMSFASPTDAVRAAMAIQDQLHKHNEVAAPDELIHARAALSAGEVRLHKSDVLGEPVSLAAKLETMAEPGDIVVSDAVVATMSSQEVRTASLGEHRINGIHRPVHVYRVVSSREGAPYGGTALAHVEEQSGASIGAGLARAISSTFDRSPRTIAYRLRRAGVDFRPLLIGGVAAVLLAGVVALVFALKDDQTPQQKAQSTIAELATKDDRSLDEDRELATAYRALSQNAAALDVYRGMRQKGATESAGLRLATELLEGSPEDASTEAAIEFLAGHPSANVDESLKSLTGNDDWWKRHNALLVLDKRATSDDAMRAAIAMKDLQSGSSCARRKWGLRLLARVGNDDAALEAVKRAKTRDDNDCMSRALDRAERTLARRLK